MKKILFILILFILILSFPFLISAQGLINNGAKIVIDVGAYVVIDGSSLGSLTNTNLGVFDNDGSIVLEGNFTNSANNNLFTNTDALGEVVFAGTTQDISNSTATNFVNFENVTINTGSTTKLLNGSAATVNQVLDIDGNLILKSPLANETPTGSLITGTGVGSIIGDGNISVERFFKVANRWQYISSPIVGQKSNLFTQYAVSNVFNNNLYTYNESYNAPTNPANILYTNYIEGYGFEFYKAWEVFQTIEGTPVTLNTSSGFKTGYITYNDGNLNTVFTSATPSDLNHQASYAPFIECNLNDGNSDYYDGWNLVGNPYPCALDWNSIAKTNINNCVYMWDGDAGNYVYFNGGDGTSYKFTNQTLNGGSQYIPAMQSFFVKATTEATSSLTIPASARVHSTTTDMLKDDEVEEVDFNYLKLKVTFQDFSDELLVRFADGVQTSFDSEYDAFKMYSTTEVLPQISTLINNESSEIPLAMNSLPLSSINNIIIPIDVVAKETGIYNFTVEEINYLENGEVFLIDKNNDADAIWTDLNDINFYSCQIEKGEHKNRLFLFFAPEGTTPDGNNLFNNEELDVQIYSDFKNIYLKINNGRDFAGEIEVYNILGQLIYKKNTSLSYEILNLDISSGEYIVKFALDNDFYVEKILIF